MTERVQDGAAVGVAFVGCAHPHIVPRLQVLAETPGARLVGGYDPDAFLAGALQERFGLRPFSSAGALLDQPDVGLAIVEGWDEDNPGYAREALYRERAVLLEKPGAPDPPALQALLDEARAAPVPFQVGYMLACSPAVAQARRILDSGVLGPLTLARFHAPGPVGSACEPCLSRPGDLGGVVYGDGAHVVHLIVRLLGAPRRVTASLLRLPPGPPVLAQDLITGTLTQQTREVPFGGAPHEDAGAAVLEYADKLVTFDMTAWGAHPWVEAWTVELYGAEGTLQLGLQPPWYRLYLRRPRGGYQAGWHTWEGAGVNGTANSLVADSDYRNELEQMLARVRAWDTENGPWIAEAEAVGAVLEAIYRSHRTGTTVSVSLSASASASLSAAGDPATGGGAPASTWPVTHPQIAWPPIGPAREGT